MSPFFEGEDLGGQGRVAHLGSEETNQYSAMEKGLQSRASGRDVARNVSAYTIDAVGRDVASYVSTR